MADDPLPASDPLHWTGREQTWNFMCASCHSTGLVRGYLHPHFIHTEGRRDIGEDRSGGFVFRTRDQLVQACRNRAFRLTGFALYAVSGWVMADRRTVVVEACYVHNQFNDPRVRGVDGVKMNGRPVVPRIANETISIGADGRAVIEKHWAVDSDLALVLGGCRAGLPAD